MLEKIIVRVAKTLGVFRKAERSVFFKLSFFILCGLIGMLVDNYYIILITTLLVFVVFVRELFF